MGSLPWTAGAAGVAPIAHALKENRTLAHLGLAAVGLGPSRDAAKRLAEALGKNADLLSLDVEGAEALVLSTISPLTRN